MRLFPLPREDGFQTGDNGRNKFLRNVWDTERGGNGLESTELAKQFGGQMVWLPGMVSNRITDRFWISRNLLNHKVTEVVKSVKNRRPVQNRHKDCRTQLFRRG